MINGDKLSHKLFAVDDLIKGLSDHKLGAVLIPIFPKERKILLTLRSLNLTNHPGQIAFPGGKYDEEDSFLINTCYRETEEEIGLKKEQIRIVGRLSPIQTHTKFLIYPFVGLIENGFTININSDEVEEIFYASIDDLLIEKNERLVEREGEIVYAYHVSNRIIWGITGNILKELLSILKSL